MTPACDGATSTVDGAGTLALPMHCVVSCSFNGALYLLKKVLTLLIAAKEYLSGQKKSVDASENDTRTAGASIALDGADALCASVRV